MLLAPGCVFATPPTEQQEPQVPAACLCAGFLRARNAEPSAAAAASEAPKPPAHTGTPTPAHKGALTSSATDLIRPRLSGERKALSFQPFRREMRLNHTQQSCLLEAARPTSRLWGQPGSLHGKVQ